MLRITYHIVCDHTSRKCCYRSKGKCYALSNPIDLSIIPLDSDAVHHEKDETVEVWGRRGIRTS
ncbi:hypothetical protein GCM10008013_19710 [Paenibacillus segetis]|uniref:Uncharacterized protein n=1 Tax=Paenibacillus segetis TaxID=1325360 RepID=A0ABQ1YDW9_9BACL|nr:hypothetical protein GCM10008013_19710 [Paenibacillus segetis]